MKDDAHQCNVLAFVILYGKPGLKDIELVLMKFMMTSEPGRLQYQLVIMFISLIIQVKHFPVAVVALGSLILRVKLSIHLNYYRLPRRHSVIYTSHQW